MPKRKSLSKKTRFEVFKRDKFSCSYCGSTPPKVILEVDHIIPVASGGDNDKNNLTTSCFDCNRGKGSASLDAVSRPISDKLKELEEKELQINEMEVFLKNIRRRENRQINKIRKIYSEHFPDKKLSLQTELHTVRTFIRKLPVDEVAESMILAISKMYGSDRCFRYFCGICWRKINGTSRW